MPIETHVTAVEKEQKPFKLLRFTIDKTAFDPQTYDQLNHTAQSLDRLADVVALLHEWSVKSFKDLGVATDALTARPLLLQMGKQITAWLAIKNEVKKSLNPPYDNNPPPESEIKELATFLGLGNWPKDNPDQAFVGTTEEAKNLEARLSTVSTINHDTASPVTPIFGYLEMISHEAGVNRRYRAPIRRGLKKAVDASVYCMELLKNPYPSEEVTVNDFISQIFEKANYGRIDVKAQTEFADTKIIWSDTWMSSLASNLIQNMAKAYDSVGENLHRQGFVYLRNVMRNSRKFIRIDIEDRGPGLPPTFSGFKPGFTWWRGHNIQKVSTGLGMYLQAEAIKKHYDGDMIAEVVTGEAGEMIGTRISIFLPVKIEA